MLKKKEPKKKVVKTLSKKQKSAVKEVANRKK